MAVTGDDNTTNKPTTVKAYDDVPYPSFPYPDTHPNKLATTAILFGLTPAPVNCCSVLELACGSGNNLIAMATELPGSKFVGIDLAENEIKIANEKLNDLHMNNIQIKHMSITDITPEFGKFDYIIAHGVYSWVPDFVREKILSVCQNNLNKNGVAFISYNTFPGWHALGMLREMMKYHIRDIKDHKTAVYEARAFMEFLANATPPNTAYSVFLKNEVERTKNFPDNYFYHDQLADNNQPFYFYEFADAIGKYGLKYLRECDLQVTTSRNFSPEVSNVLNTLGNDIIYIEQHIDFIINRMFRETLICHEDANIQRLVTPANIENLYFTSKLVPVDKSVPISPDIEVKFTAKKGADFSSKGPSSKALWLFLSESSPKPLDINVITAGVMEILQQNKDALPPLPTDNELKDMLLADLLWGISIGFIQLYTTPINVCTTVSTMPQAAPLTRYEAARHNWVTSQLHEHIWIDNLSHHLLPLLDGSNDINALIDKMSNLADQGKLQIKKEGQPVTDRLQLREILKPQIEMMLKNFAKQGFLVG